MLGAIWLLAPRGLPARALGLAAVPAAAAAARAIRSATGAFEAVFIDVGQGLSVLVRTRGHALLLRRGRALSVRVRSRQGRRAADLARARRLRRSTRIIVSHGDNDHAGGAPAVAHEYSACANASAASRIAAICRCASVVAGEAWDWDGVRFPRDLAGVRSDRCAEPRGDNDRSCVLLVEGEGSRLLLPGDISSAHRAAHRVRHDDDGNDAARARGRASRQPHFVERCVHRGHCIRRSRSSRPGGTAATGIRIPRSSRDSARPALPLLNTARASAH